MFRSRAFYGQLLLIYLLLPGFSKPALSQTKPSGNINLSHIETSIDRGKLQEVETPLIDYAIAHPNDARALELLGKLRYRQHRLEEAQSLYQRVLVLNPSLTRAKINLGRLTYELGQREQARRLLAEIDITSAVKLDDRLALAKALVLTGEFQKGLAVAESLPISVRNGAALPLRVAIFIGLGQRQRLVDLAPSIRRAAVSNAQVAAEVAEVFQAAGMFREAGDLLRLALPRAPNNFRLLVLLGQIEVHLGNLVDARRHLNRAVKLEPNEATSLFAFGLLESAERNYEAALSNFKQAHALASDSTPILVQLVVNAMRANRTQIAVDAANKLLQLKPDDSEFLYLLGAASLQHGSLTAAQNALERYTVQRPDDPRACLALGITFARQHEKNEQAKRQFEKCLKLDPTNVEARYQMGLILKSEGDVEKAISMFEEATRGDSQHANVLRDLGSLYLQTGAELKAREVLERAVALNAEDPETHFLLSRLYNLIGESSLAKQHLALFQKIKGQREKLSSP